MNTGISQESFNAIITTNSAQLAQSISKLMDRIELQKVRATPNFNQANEDALIALAMLDELIKNIRMMDSDPGELFYAYYSKANLYHEIHDYSNVALTQRIMKRYAGNDVQRHNMLESQASIINTGITAFNVQH